MQMLYTDALTLLFKIGLSPDEIWQMRKVSRMWRSAAKRAYKEMLDADISSFKRYLVYDRSHKYSARERIRGELSWGDVDKYYDCLHDFYDNKYTEADPLIDEDGSELLLGTVLSRKDYERFTRDLCQKPFGHRDWRTLNYLIRTSPPTKDYIFFPKTIWNKYKLLQNAIDAWHQSFDSKSRGALHSEYKSMACGQLEELDIDLLKCFCHILLIDFQIYNVQEYDDRLNNTFKNRKKSLTFLEDRTID